MAHPILNTINVLHNLKVNELYTSKIGTKLFRAAFRSSGGSISKALDPAAIDARVSRSVFQRITASSVRNFHDQVSHCWVFQVRSLVDAVRGLGPSPAGRSAEPGGAASVGASSLLASPEAAAAKAVASASKLFSLTPEESLLEVKKYGVVKIRINVYRQDEFDLGFKPARLPLIFLAGTTQVTLRENIQLRQRLVALVPPQSPGESGDDNDDMEEEDEGGGASVFAGMGFGGWQPPPVSLASPFKSEGFVSFVGNLESRLKDVKDGLKERAEDVKGSIRRAAQDAGIPTTPNAGSQEEDARGTSSADEGAGAPSVRPSETAAAKAAPAAVPLRRRPMPYDDGDPRRTVREAD